MSTQHTTTAQRQWNWVRITPGEEDRNEIVLYRCLPDRIHQVWSGKQVKGYLISDVYDTGIMVDDELDVLACRSLAVIELREAVRDWECIRSNPYHDPIARVMARGRMLGAMDALDR